jgi:hypothetical protein
VAGWLVVVGFPVSIMRNIAGYIPVLGLLDPVTVIEDVVTSGVLWYETVWTQVARVGVGSPINVHSDLMSNAKPLPIISYAREEISELFGSRVGVVTYY